MGSYSRSSSVAVDNRQAVTDDGVGVSVYGGSGSNVAMGADAFSVYGRANTSAFNGDVNKIYNYGTITDAGAVGKAFDFANNSLSVLMQGLIDKDKERLRQQETDSGGVDAAINEGLPSGEDVEQKASSQLVNGLLLAAVSYYFFGGG